MCGHRFYAGQLLLLLVIVCTAVKSSSIYNILDNATLEVKIYCITKCRTTGYFLPIFSSLLKKEQNFIDSNQGKKIQCLREKIFFRKNCFKTLLFLPLIQSKNEHPNFQKHLKQKRCAIGRLNVSNFCYFSNELRLTG